MWKSSLQRHRFRSGPSYRVYTSMFQSTISWYVRQVMLYMWRTIVRDANNQTTSFEGKTVEISADTPFLWIEAEPETPENYRSPQITGAQHITNNQPPAGQLVAVFRRHVCRAFLTGSQMSISPLRSSNVESRITELPITQFINQ